MKDSLSKVVAGRFKGEREMTCDIRALAYHSVLLGSFALLCAGVLPAAVFVPVGFCAYIRNFNAIHEASHARRDRRNPLRRLQRLGMIVHSPLQLGREELGRAHRLHHAYPDDPARDPHVAAHHPRWWVAALYAGLAPELGLLTHLRRERRVSAGLVRGLMWHSAVTAAMLAAAGSAFLWWVLVTRLGSVACWFVFDWILHHPRVWGPSPLRVGRPLQVVWAALFSRDNLHASMHHVLHHRYAWVADRDLPALAEFLAAREGAATG